MDGYGALITAILVGAGSLLTALGGFIVTVRRGDPTMKAEIEQLKVDRDAERDARREVERRQLVTEARLYDALSRLVRAGLMSQAELEGEMTPTPDPIPGPVS